MIAFVLTWWIINEFKKRSETLSWTVWYLIFSIETKTKKWRKHHKKNTE